MTKTMGIASGLVLALALFATGPALAGPYDRPSGSGVHVTLEFNPWVPHAAAPPPRAGYVWVSGHYNKYGQWFPGWYQPTQTRPGYLYHPGYWSGVRYVDGRWAVAHSDRRWVSGYYRGQRWEGGHWDTEHQDTYHNHGDSDRGDDHDGHDNDGHDSDGHDGGDHEGSSDGGDDHSDHRSDGHGGA